MSEDVKGGKEMVHTLKRWWWKCQIAYSLTPIGRRGDNFDLERLWWEEDWWCCGCWQSCGCERSKEDEDGGEEELHLVLRACPNLSLPFGPR